MPIYCRSSYKTVANIKIRHTFSKARQLARTREPAVAIKRQRKACRKIVRSGIRYVKQEFARATARRYQDTNDLDLDAAKDERSLGVG